MKIELPDFDQVAREVTEEIHRRVVRRTPVNTGRARDGWELELTENGGTITNQVPYIGVLEYGSSEQAPTGMVRVTLEELDPIVRNAINKTIGENK